MINKGNMFIDYKVTPELYAELYAKVDITGTTYLGFRDIPKIIDKYTEGIKTLDYGCGVGKSTLFLKSCGLQVTGVDINSKMIEVAKRLDPQGNYKLIKSAQLQEQNDEYDIVFSSWVLMEIANKEEIIKVIKEIKRVLKKNGMFIFIVCNENTYNREWLSDDARFEENKNLKSGSRVKIFFKDAGFSIYDYFWTEDDYKEIISKGGLDLIEIYKPLGKASDKYHWINEHLLPPFSIYVTNNSNHGI